MAIVESKSKEVLRLWLRMLSTTTQVEQQLKRLLKENFDITLAQFDLMAELARAGEPRTMSEVSQMLMVSNGNVTGVVDRLSKEGYLEPMIVRQVWMEHLEGKRNWSFRLWSILMFQSWLEKNSN